MRPTIFHPFVSKEVMQNNDHMHCLLMNKSIWTPFAAVWAIVKPYLIRQFNACDTFLFKKKITVWVLHFNNDRKSGEYLKPGISVLCALDRLNNWITFEFLFAFIYTQRKKLFKYLHEKCKYWIIRNLTVIYVFFKVHSPICMEIVEREYSIFFLNEGT